MPQKVRQKKNNLRPRPKVTVIMSVYNTERFVAEAIQSALDQTLKNFEFIIINDNSKDKSDKIIRSFKDPRIKYFKRNYNKGKSHSVNYAFKMAKGKYACIFDADDIMVNYKLEVSAKILDRNPEYGLLYGDAWVIDEASEIIGPLSFPSRAKRYIDDPFPNLKFSNARLRKGALFSQGSTMFRMEAIRKVGGLDKSLKVAEDWDLWVRIAEKYKVYYKPVPMYLYRINPKGLFNQALMAKKHEQAIAHVRKKMRQRAAEAKRKGG